MSVADAQVHEKDMSALAGKYLTFFLGDEEYGLEILKVQEIIEMMEITRVPRVPEYVRGVINLRGKVIPVVDLRAKFGLEKAEESRKTCIIVVKVQRGDSSVVMGTIVDEVSEVVEISPEEIEPAPAFGTQVDTTFILGMRKTNDSFKILLDIDKVLSEGDVEALARTAS